MARPILVTTLIAAAFGLGFGARHFSSPPTLEAPEPPLLTAPEEFATATESRPERASEGQSSLPPLTAAPPVVASLAPPAPLTPQSAAAPPSAGSAPLAYAPAAPVPPAAPSPSFALPPPPDIPAFPSTVAPADARPAPAEEIAAPKLAPFPPADVDAMRDVIAQMRKGDVAAADAAIRKLSDPVARTLGEWALARSALRAMSYARILSFIEKNPDWPTQALLQRRAEEALSAEQKPASVVAAFFANRKPVSASGRIVLARALLAQKKKDEAAAIIRAVWREDNLTDETENRLASEFAELLRREDHRARMERHIFKAEMGKALRSANRAGPEYAALVRARQAVENKAANAKALLDAIPKTLHADSSYMFARAQFARRANQTADAVKAMEGAPRDPDILVDGDEWWVERRLIARKLLDAGDAKLAYKVAAEHGGESDATRVEAEFHAGWIALRFLNDPKLAAGHFDKAAEAAKMPMSVSRAAYWQGRAAEARGDQAAAESHYRKAAIHGGFYYGQLARAKLPAFDDQTVTGGVPERAEDLANDPALRAASLLASLGEREMLMSFIVDLATRSGSPAQIRALGDILTEKRDARGVLVLGKLAMQRGVAIDRHAFPTFGIPDYQSLTEIVETPMVHAIARQESAFDPRAVSHAGARGLMQLMPGTARITAQRFKAPFDVGRLTSDPSYNAQIGSAHLGDLLNEWRGSYILVFAAYNAGSHNVKKWIEAYGDPREPRIDPIDWVERIPFTETRNYVQRVMENLQMYRTRLNPGAPMTIEADLRRSTVPTPVRSATIAGEASAPSAPR